MNVLALETDAVQAHAIGHVVCNLVGARLTVATSVEHALHVLRTSTPDLVLLPALVSPSQESTLIDALRTLPDASHVDTLITPVLPPPAGALITAPQGWRRWTSRRGPAPATSVEADAFAESLRWALERAREAKEAHVEDLGFQDATNRLLRKLSPPSASDRRQYRRFAASELPGLRSARIKSGPSVAVVDVSAGGALLETDARLPPDSEALLELIGSARQAVIPFRVLRCSAAGMNGVSRYLGACAFKQPLDLDELAWAAASAAGLDASVPALTLVPARIAVRNAW